MSNMPDRFELNDTETTGKALLKSMFIVIIHP